MAQQNIRIIAPARPYYSDSDPYPAGADTTKTVAADTLELLDHLNIDCAGLITRRTGFRFGIELIQSAPHRITFNINISPALPAHAEEQYRGLSTYPRLISKAILNNRPLVIFIANLAYKYLQKHGARKFAEFLNRASSIDKKTIANPTNWLTVLAGFEFSSTNGPKAYLHEVDYDPRKIWKNCLNTEVELTCVVGELDPNDRINRAHILAAAGAPLDIHIVKSAGQLIHLSHWQEVANLVLAKISQLNTDHNSPAEASR